MDRFTYEPLPLGRPPFQLIRLLHGNDPSIHCELFQASLNDEDGGMEYEALSYT